MVTAEELTMRSLVVLVLIALLLPGAALAQTGKEDTSKKLIKILAGGSASPLGQLWPRNRVKALPSRVPSANANVLVFDEPARYWLSHRRNGRHRALEWTQGRSSEPEHCGGYCRRQAGQGSRGAADVVTWRTE